MAKKISKRVTNTKNVVKRPSKVAQAAAEALLAPLHDLLKASVAQNEINSGLLTTLNTRVEKLAGQLDALQKTAPTPADPKLLTEPAPLPSNVSPLVE